MLNLDRSGFLYLIIHNARLSKLSIDKDFLWVMMNHATD